MFKITNKRKLVIKGFLIGSLVFIMALILIRPASAYTKTDKYVRIANYYLKAGTDIKRSDYDKLAKYDLLVLPVEAQVYNKDLFSYLRKANQDIIILAYIPARSINTIWRDSLHQKLLSDIKQSWYLRDSNGNKVSLWPGTWALNMNTGWPEYLASFTHNKVLSTGLWDGVFYDEVDSHISYSNNGDLDVNMDGYKDNPNEMDKLWQNGFVKLFSKTRQLVGGQTIIFINGSSLDKYQPYLNGRMFENFPTPWERQGRWVDSMESYKSLSGKVGYTPIFIINGNTGNTGNYNNFKKVRFGLASTLMNDGYFSFDYGDQDHGQLVWYDEFNVFLGLPKTEAYNVFDKNNKKIKESIWRRDFENGLVLVNSTGETKRISLGGEYEKLHGYQDPKYNDGAIIERVTIPAKDGLLLLRPIERIEGGVFTNGSFARVFDQNGRVVRNGFFAYDKHFRGGSNIIIKDLDSDGLEEKVVADRNHVDIYNNLNIKIKTFYPYGREFKYGLNIAADDLNGDGVSEIVTGTQRGGSPLVKIFNLNGDLLHPGFFAYNKNFRGGVQVAIGDLNGDGWKEIIAGAGNGGGPHIRIFSSDGRLINPGFFAYDPAFRGGVNVAVGDLNGDGISEIIAGSGFGGGPHVRIFNKDGKLLSAGFFAFNKSNRGGVKVIVADLDKDGKDEIIASSTSVFTLSSFRSSNMLIAE